MNTLISVVGSVAGFLFAGLLIALALAFGVGFGLGITLRQQGAEMRRRALNRAEAIAAARRAAAARGYQPSLGPSNPGPPKGAISGRWDSLKH